MCYTFCMSDTKILQAILGGQVGIRNSVSEVRNDLNKLDKKIDRAEENLTSRLDKIGLQLARLEDDTPKPMSLTN